MSEKKRVTYHNSRCVKGSSRGYTAKHNDRSFNLEKANNIDPSRTCNNIYWTWMSKKYVTHAERPDRPEYNFEYVEDFYYYEHFYYMYEEQMQKHIASRHKKRCKTFEDWYRCQRYCPEETQFQIGKVGNQITSAEAKQFMIRVNEALHKYAAEHNNCFKILDMALHLDEKSPHLQMRKVWQYSSEDNIYVETLGHNRIGQAEALEQAGISLPDPAKSLSKENNRKMTFDHEIREILFGICDEMHIEIERIPDANAKHNRTKEAYLNDLVNETKQKADQIINNAKQEADQIINNANKEADKIIFDKINEFDSFTAIAVQEREKRIQERRREAEEITPHNNPNHMHNPVHKPL